MSEAEKKAKSLAAGRAKAAAAKRAKMGAEGTKLSIPNTKPRVVRRARLEMITQKEARQRAAARRAKASAGTRKERGMRRSTARSVGRKK
jgi:hypothetical protein